MKRVVFIALLLISVAAITMIATTCDVFLTPQNGRENPLDPDSPVPAPDGVYAEYVEAEEMVKIYIDLPDDQKNTKGFVTIRKTGSAPTSINDGEEVSRDKWGDVEETGYIGDTGYKEGKLNYYGVWAYGEDEYEEHYTGPVAGSAGVPTEIVLEVIADGYIDDTNATYFTSNSLGVKDAAAPWEIAMVKFDVSSIIGLQAAYLNLYCNTIPAPPDDIEGFRIIQSWSEENPPDSYTTVDSDSFRSSIIGIPMTTISSTGWVSCDATAIVENWVLIGHPNHGILLGPMGAEVLFDSKESEGNIPELVIYGWEE